MPFRTRSELDWRSGSLPSWRLSQGADVALARKPVNPSSASDAGDKPSEHRLSETSHQTLGEQPTHSITRTILDTSAGICLELIVGAISAV
jgi:hypothetical protein